MNDYGNGSGNCFFTSRPNPDLKTNPNSTPTSTLTLTLTPYCTDSGVMEKCANENGKEFFK